MEVTKHQVRFLETLQDKGIGFIVGHTFLGEFVIQPCEIELFINDPEEFAARKLCVERNQYQAWNEFMSSSQCLGVTKAGRRCKNLANFGFRVSVKDYGAMNENCYCPKHRQHITTKKNSAS